MRRIVEGVGTVLLLACVVALSFVISLSMVNQFAKEDAARGDLTPCGHLLNTAQVCSAALAECQQRLAETGGQ